MARTDSVKTESIELQFVDGSQRTLSIHGLRALELVGRCDDFGFKSWAELQTEATAGSLRSILFAVKVVADALTFPDQEAWTPQKVRESLMDTAVARAFFTAVQLSVPAQVAKAMGSFKVTTRKPTLYEMG